MRRQTAVIGACLALVLAGGCAGMTGTAARDHDAPRARVVVLDLGGKASAEVRSRVVRVLAGRYRVVSKRRYQHTARKLEARELASGPVASVAADLDLDVVVHGRVRRLERGRYRLELTLRNGATGEVADILHFPLRSRRLRRKTRRAMQRQLFARMDGLARDHAERDSADAPDSRFLMVEEASRERRRDRRTARRGDRDERRDRSARDDQRREREQQRRAEAEAERERERRAEREREQRAERQAVARRERDDRRRSQRRGRRSRDRDEGGRADVEVARNEPEPDLEITRDESGQALDDEMPAILK